MKYAKVDGVKIPVSKIVSGTAQYEEWLEEKPLFEVLDAALENGINAIDSGREYADGAAEKAIGNWMESRKCREKTVLISKGGHHTDLRKRVTPYDISADIMDSLVLLKTGYIDIYLLHRDDETKEVGPIVESLHSHYEAGRIRSYGASNWTQKRVKEANEYAKKHSLRPFTIVSQHFSIGEMVGDAFGGGCISLSSEESKPDREWYAKERIALFAYSSLCMGFFSGRINRENYKKMYEEKLLAEPAYRVYCNEENFRRLDRALVLADKKGVSVSQIALSYIISYGEHYNLNTFALVAADNKKEVIDNAGAANLTLTKEEIKWLYVGE